MHTKQRQHEAGRRSGEGHPQAIENINKEVVQNSAQPLDVGTRTQYISQGFSLALSMLLRELYGEK
jgi:hypothetical protein